MTMLQEKTRILLTGFSPFGNSAVNPSWEAVKQVAVPQNVELMRLEIPTVFYKSAQVLAGKIEEFKPDVVLCVGQAAGRAEITPERIAININDAKKPDNGGNIPHNELIDSEGPPAYFSGFPIEKIIEALHSEDIPVRISFSAGTYVCNHLFYSLMDLINQKELPIIGGFVHIPCIPEQVGRDFQPSTPSLPIEVIVHGLEVITNVLLDDFKQSKLDKAFCDS